MWEVLGKYNKGLGDLFHLAEARSCFLTKANLHLTASASRMLGLQAYATSAQQEATFIMVTALR